MYKYEKQYNIIYNTIYTVYNTAQHNTTQSSMCQWDDVAEEKE